MAALEPIKKATALSCRQRNPKDYVSGTNLHIDNCHRNSGEIASSASTLSAEVFEQSLKNKHKTLMNHHRLEIIPIFERSLKL